MFSPFIFPGPALRLERRQVYLEQKESESFHDYFTLWQALEHLCS